MASSLPYSSERASYRHRFANTIAATRFFSCDREFFPERNIRFEFFDLIPDTLPALLAQRLNSASPALIDRGRPVSYRELADASARMAQGLRKLGVRAGDCVALWLPN